MTATKEPFIEFEDWPSLVDLRRLSLLRDMDLRSEN